MPEDIIGAVTVMAVCINNSNLFTYFLVCIFYILATGTVFAKFKTDSGVSKICPDCKSEILGNAKKCKFCGTSV